MSEQNSIPVVPAPGQMETVAQDLIRLADHPHDVVWRARERDFMVPEQVAIRYAEEQAGQLAEAAEQAGDKAATKPRSRRRASSAAPAGEKATPAGRARRRGSKTGDADKPARRARGGKKGEEVNPDA